MLLKEIFLPYEEAQLLKKRMPGILTENEFDLFNSNAHYGTIFRKCVNEKILKDLQDFKYNPIESALIVRGLPIDSHLPPTPYTAHSNLFDVTLAASLNIALYNTLGIFPVTYKGENDGRLFRDVVPKTYAVHEKSSLGSSRTLGMHVDDCHLPLVPETSRTSLSIAPEYLSLFGMRCDLKVATKISFLDEVVKRLDAETIKVLKKPLFELSLPDSFSTREKYTLPILIQDEAGTYYSRFDKEYTNPLTDEAKSAFTKFEETLYGNGLVHNIFLQGGDFLIFKNQRVTHSREAFQARFDGTDRWLMRLFGVNDLSRTIPVEHSNRYYVTST